MTSLAFALEQPFWVPPTLLDLFPRRLRWAATLTALVIARRAHAEPPPASSSPPVDASMALVAPRLISSPEVTYPEGAHGDAVVRLVLTVGRDGSVEAARAVE